MDAWRDQIVAEAETWCGTKWHHNARVKGGGVDCGQLVIACYVAVGLVENFTTGQYPADWMLHRSEERYLGFVKTYLDEVDHPSRGDVAVWKIGRCFSHGAIVTEWPKFIHAFLPSRKVCHATNEMGALRNKEVKFFSIAGRLV